MRMEGGRDATNWDEQGYRSSILQERETQSRTVFRTVFAPSPNPNPDVLVVASSDGSLAPYSISSCISSSQPMRFNNSRYHQPFDFLVAEPLHFIQGHSGPAYDAKFYGEGEDCLLLSCGDDGRIRGWKWEEVLNSDLPLSMQGNHLNPVFDLVNPQHKGPWGALSPIPENNAIAVDSQIITGSEDGTARVWDCKSGKCVQVINPKDKSKLKESSSWVSCIAVDTSESWLACGSDRNLSVWSLPAYTCCWSRTCADMF